METIHEVHTDIKGWGIDSDPRNEPAYPIKNYTGDDHKRLSYTRPPLQKKTVEVLKSNERPTLSAVYGTSTPPSGLSGIIRRFAYRYSESSFNHWFPLMLADRINVIEGYVSDLRAGNVPNILREKGMKAFWKHDRKAFITRTAVKLAVASVLIAVFVNSRRKKRAKID